MSLYSLPNFIISIYTLSMGIFVLLSKPKAAKNQACFLVTLVTFLWLFCYGLAYSTNDFQKAFILLKLGHASAVLVSPFIYYFAFQVARRYEKKFDKYALILTFFYAFFTVFLLYGTTGYMPTLHRYYWGYYPVGGVMMISYFLYTFALVLRLVYILINGSRSAQKELRFEDYQRFKYYALSIVIFIFAAIDYLPKFGITFYPFGYVFVAAFASITTYAIVRHKLLDIDLVIRRSFLYSLLISAITFIYLLLVLIGEVAFRSFFNYGSIVVAIITSGIIAIIFNPLRTGIENIIDRYFLKIDPEKIIQENFQMRNELQKQDKMKAIATLAAGMAHEIKNPLTSIRTFSEYLPYKYNDPEFREKFSKIVVDEVDRVNNIVKQLLEFSKPQELDLKPAKISEILDETLALLTNNLLQTRVHVEKEYMADPEGSVDKNQLKQAFLNILLNAIQAMPDGGTIFVSIAQAAGQMRVNISDTGKGMAADDLPKIFDPFFTTKSDGTGLGLSITERIIKEHGGMIKATSELGKGTTFKIFLKCEQ